MTDTTNTTDDNVVPEDEFQKRREAVNTSQRALFAIGELARVYQRFEALGYPTSVWLPNVLAGLPEPYNKTFGPGAERSGAVLVDLVAAFAKGGAAAAFEKMPDFVGRILGNPDGKPSVFATLGARVGMLLGGGPAGFGVGAERPEGIIEPPSDDDRDEMLAGHDHEIHAMRMRIRIEKLFAEAPKMTLADGTPDPSQAPALECTVVLRASIPPIEGSLSTTPEGGLRLLSIVPDRNNNKVMLEQFFDYTDVVAVCVQREIKAERKSPIIGAS